MFCPSRRLRIRISFCSDEPKGKADHMFHCKDSFGSTPVDYLCLNRTPYSTEVIRRALHVCFAFRLPDSEGSLESDAMRQAVEEALNVEFSSKRREIGRAYFELAKHA
eukprot:scaffold4117_cov97-Cylindrotheca_fusiformis.AAC.3